MSNGDVLVRYEEDRLEGRDVQASEVHSRAEPAKRPRGWDFAS